MSQLDLFITSIREDKYKMQNAKNYKTYNDFKKSYDKKIKELKDYWKFQNINYKEIL